MDFKTLKQLVRKGEGLHTEFKLKAKYPEKIVKELLAFSNAEGGSLFVGVGDDKSIQGLKYPREDEYALTKAIEEHCEPLLPYELERVILDNEREVLIFTVESSYYKPHYYLENKDSESRTLYYRVEDKSVKASREMREILKEESKNKEFRFQFGEKEQILMQHLDEFQKITVDEFCQKAKISRKIASRTLVLLVLAKVLKIYPNEQRDYFRLP